MARDRTAPRSAATPGSLDAALALAAERDERGAEAALRLAHDPGASSSEGGHAAEHDAAVDFCAGSGPRRRSRALDAPWLRLTHRQDPGVREAARALR